MSEIDTQILDRVTKPSKTAGIGLIVLNTDEVAGIAFNSLMPKDKVSVFETRCGYNAADGFSLTRTLAEVADDLPPIDRMKVVAFSCTSGTVAWGVERLFSELGKAFPGAMYTSPASAAILALKRLNASRIALLTPYGMETHREFLKFFAGIGFDIVANGTFPYSSDHEICELSSESIFAAGKRLTADRPDALFISCCATPVVPLIEDLEKDLGIPVVTSSQAMAWDALQLAGCYEPIQGFGRLMTLAR